jgi:hypothetical protein
LGLREGLAVLAIDVPPNYRKLLSGMPRGVAIVTEAEPPIPFVHFFATTAGVLAERLKSLKTDLALDGVIWVSWPKKASGVATDITEDTIRDVALPMSLVDVKVCAVDATWSGLKLVVRRSNRTR